MRPSVLAVLTIVLLQQVVGCRDSNASTPDASMSDSTALDARVTRLSAALANADSGAAALAEPVARWILPPELAEISGLALTPDGRLFAHDDESARITELDYRRGTVLKQFFVGEKELRGDFEGLVYVQDRFFLLSSTGTLYEFPEGTAEERVDYSTRDTGLGQECEFEGIAYDSTANALILACKTVLSTRFKNRLVLYRYALGDPDQTAISTLTIPYSEAIGANEWKQLRPTDLTVDPSNGNYVFVAAQEMALAALTPAGAVVFSRPLDSRHPQAEGVAITKDGILIISDEAVKNAATITLYRWQ